MSCDRPLDSLDLEAMASGEAPLVAPDAARHAASCAECASRLELFRAMGIWFSEAPEPGHALPGFAESVQRLRAFSRREKRSLRLWSPPLALTGALLAASALTLSIPALGSGEQARLWGALVSAFGSECRSLLLWPGALLRALPSAVSALGEVARAERGFSAASILLLLPAGFAARRVLARRKIAR